MGVIGGAFLLFMQVFMLGLAAGGIGVELGTGFKRLTLALNLPELHQVAVAAESWLMVAALIVWVVSVVVLVSGAIKRRTLDVPSAGQLGAFGPIMIFLLFGLAASFIGGAGLVVAGMVHVFAREELADLVGLVVVAGLVSWMVGVGRVAPSTSKKA